MAPSRLVRFQLTKEQVIPWYLAPLFAELIPEPVQNLHQGNLLRRCFAPLTQNHALALDGISESGSEEQGLDKPPLSISIDGTPLGDRPQPEPSGGRFRQGVPVEMKKARAYSRLRDCFWMVN